MEYREETLQEGFCGGRMGKESRQHLTTTQAEEVTRELLHPVAVLYSDFTTLLWDLYDSG